jgi:hypothetical protein
VEIIHKYGFFELFFLSDQYKFLSARGLLDPSQVAVIYYTYIMVNYYAVSTNLPFLGPNSYP